MNPTTSYRRKISTISVLVALMVVPVILFLALADDSDGPTGVPVGTVAPSIVDHPTLDGDTFSLEDYRGDWVVLNFFATWCAPCRVEHKEFIELKANPQYPFMERNPIEVVSVLFNEAESKGRDFFEELGGDWPVLIKDTIPTVLEYRIISVPETYLITPSGLIARHWKGEVTAEIINDEITRIVEQDSA